MIDGLLTYLFIGLCFTSLLSYLNDFEDLGIGNLAEILLWPFCVLLLILCWLSDEGD